MTTRQLNSFEQRIQASQARAKADKRSASIPREVTVAGAVVAVLMMLLVGVSLSGTSAATGTPADTSIAESPPSLDAHALAASTGIAEELIAADPTLLDARPTGPAAEALWLRQAWDAMPQALKDDSCSSATRLMDLTGETVSWDAAETHIDAYCPDDGSGTAGNSDARTSELALLREAWNTAGWDMRASVCQAGVGRLMIVTQFAVSWESATEFWRTVC